MQKFAARWEVVEREHLGPSLMSQGTQGNSGVLKNSSCPILHYNFCLSNCHLCLPNFETLGAFFFTSSVFSWENGTSCQSLECQIARNNISPCVEVLLWSTAIIYTRAMRVKVGWKSLFRPLVCIFWQFIIYLKYWQSRTWFSLTTISLFLDSQENVGLCTYRQNNLVFLWTRAITYHHVEKFSETKQVY